MSTNQGQGQTLGLVPMLPAAENVAVFKHVNQRPAEVSGGQ
ncbi:hypothetical protein [Demequina lutea]|uniref:Uncharacterized protein n=1 Tax=Demequina lutea TaxID=431489 RepID=A0A7Z0CGK5_9MICO|nr:hypothetical protein [Demequina lutea]NYI40501.1 hypothetical protein [Demequina lutea]